MRHIVPLLCVHYALSTLFLPSYSCCSSFLAHYTPYMLLRLFSFLFHCHSYYFTVLLDHFFLSASICCVFAVLLYHPSTLFSLDGWLFLASFLYPSQWPCIIPGRIITLGWNISSVAPYSAFSTRIIRLWSIPFCGEPSSYSPVMIGVLVTLCICSVIQDILISQKIALSLMSITLIATHHCCHASQYFVTSRAFSFLHHLTVATIALPRKVRKVIEKCFIQNWMRCF